MKHIAFIGVGGVGGYFGGKMTTILQKHEDIKVYFIARGEHLKQIQKNGLILKTELEGERVCKPTLATEKIEDLPILDACFIAVKAYDLENVLIRLKDCINEQTEVIPLLNGVDMSQRIREVIKKGIVYPACVYVGTHIEAPGIVCQKGGNCTIILGRDERFPNQKPKWIMDLMKEAQIQHQWHLTCTIEIWKKYLFIASYGLVTAALGKTLGEVYEEETTKQMVLKVIQEIACIGIKEGVGITKEMMIDALEKAKTFPYETKTSFQRDYEKGGEDERVLFGGTMLRLAQLHDVEIPTIDKLYQLL